MYVKIAGLSALIAITFFAACSLFPPQATGNMPTSISINVPQNMKNAVPPMLESLRQQAPGQGYSLLKMFVNLGVNATTSIDQILSSIGSNYGIFQASAGNKVTVGQGWFFFNNNLNPGSYLFYGSALNKTNLYIDWVRADSNKFSGKVLYYSDNPGDNMKPAVVYYNNDPSSAYVKVFFDFTGAANNNGMEKMRVELYKSGTSAVNAYIIAITTNAATNNIKVENVVGYGSASSDGGVYAWLNGYFTTNFGGAPVDTAKNPNLIYSYEEYFDYAGNTSWSKELISVLGTNSNISVPLGGTNYTNSKPSVSTTVLGLTNTAPTDANYPSITLPVIP